MISDGKNEQKQIDSKSQNKAVVQCLAVFQSLGVRVSTEREEKLGFTEPPYVNILGLWEN